MNTRTKAAGSGVLLESMPGAFKFKIFPHQTVSALFTDRGKDFSIRHNGLSRAFALRQDFLTHLGLPAKNLVCLKQVHSSRIVYVAGDSSVGNGQDFERNLPCADALITDRKDVPLAVFIADCLAVYFFDPEKKIIAIAHAGWRGSAEGICRKVINTLTERFGARQEDLLVALSPSIRPCCYEVGPELRTFFKESFIERDGKLFLDLIQENKEQMMSLGVKKEHIFDPGLCTACQNDEFFSHRKEGVKSGRMMAAIMLH